MEDTFTRFVNNLLGRLDGPLHFRLILQPTMAIFFAVRDGLRDARQSRPAYLWSLITEPTLRRDLLRGGWRSISRIFILAVILDGTYQLIVFHWFYPFETLVVSVVLALIPYLLVRGPVNRIRRFSNVPAASARSVAIHGNPKLERGVRRGK